MTLFQRGLSAALLFATALSAQHQPEVRIYSDKVEAGAAVAHEISDLIAQCKQAEQPCVLGLATGSTPLPVYQEIRRLYHAGELDLSGVSTFNLDEYVGIDRGHPESYHRFMWDELFEGLLWSPRSPKGIRAKRIHVPPANVSSITQLGEREFNRLHRVFRRRDYGSELNKRELAWVLKQRASRYERQLRQEGPVDLQILGIGENGHIAFCEPGSPRDGRTSIVELTENTREVNARFFDGDLDRVPTHAMSMGLASIMSAKRIILIATGERKREAVDLALNGPITENVPASLLRLHPNVSFVLDAAAVK